MKQNSIFRSITVLLLVCVIVLGAFGGTAMADQARSNNRFNVVIVLDASESMKQSDPNGYRYDAIQQFVALMAESGNYLGCVVFQTELKAQMAPIPVNSQSDKDKVLEALQSVKPSYYTNTGAALAKAVEMLNTHGDPDLPSKIVFLCDGLTDMPTQEGIETSLQQKADAIIAAQDANIEIYSVILNYDNSADTTEMEQLAIATGGAFAEVKNSQDLQDAFLMFYKLIFGPDTITLKDEVFPDSGVLETTFQVPGIGVEEVNIVIYGEIAQIQELRLEDPNSNTSNVKTIDGGTFSILKITNVMPGRWRLITRGIPGDSIKINMVYNTNLDVDLSVSPSGNATTDEQVTISARLTGGNVPASDASQYTGYSAELVIMDGYGQELETVPMSVSGNCFQVSRKFAQGTYRFRVNVSGNYLNCQPKEVGPLVVSDAPPPPNSAPVPVEAVITKDVSIWPFKGGSLTLDLTTLATDAEDAELHYEIIKTAFLPGTDYTVDANNVLTMHNFSLRKGAYFIRATDSGGLSCDIEVVVRAIDIGLLTLIGLGVIALIVAAILGIGLWLALTKPFRGTITAKSYCNGVSRGEQRKPRRGRAKLSIFGMDSVGLNYSKCYFQATGQNYIYLVTNQPVLYNGTTTNKVRIQSGAMVTVYVRQGDPRSLQIHFVSNIKPGGHKHMGGPRHKPGPKPMPHKPGPKPMPPKPPRSW